MWGVYGLSSYAHKLNIRGENSIFFSKSVISTPNVELMGIARQSVESGVVKGSQETQG